MKAKARRELDRSVTQEHRDITAYALSDTELYDRNFKKRTDRERRKYRQAKAALRADVSPED